MILEKLLLNGDRWWRNAADQLHRDNDLPAIDRANGDREWFVNGRHHRDRGLPAVMRANGGIMATIIATVVCQQENVRMVIENGG